MLNFTFSRSWTSFLVCGFIAIACYGQSVQAQSSQSDDIKALIPVIMLLLQSDEIELRVGQLYDTEYPSSRYPNGIGFSYPTIHEDVELTLNMSGIPAGAMIEIYINGELVGVLSNGVNRFTINASDLKKNSIEIRVKAGTSGSWTIDSIGAFLLTGPRTRAEAQLFLMRATFGPTKAELDTVLQIGYEAWLDQQFETPQTMVTPFYDQALIDRSAALRIELIASGITDPDELDFKSIIGAGQRYISRMDAWWNAAINGNDQLRQRVIYALSQIFVISEIEGSGRPLRTALYHDILGENGFGNYYDLLKNITLSPTMGMYLGLVNNKKAGGLHGDDGTQPDENYAREIMQLFSIGLVELNIDGTPKLVGGEQVETYDQDTIRNFARVFTGWHVIGGRYTTPNYQRTPLVRYGDHQPFHDFGAKTLLNGHVNEAGLSTEEDMDLALRNIFEHPNVGPFIGTRLIERLVTSNPSPAYVRRVAQVFNDNGNGVRGDLKAVIKAILLDPEAINSVDNTITGGKLKEPIIRLSQLWRAMSAKSDIKYIRYSGTNKNLGQRPFSAQTVFNFYEPTYAPSGLISQQNLVAPEFKIIDDNLIINYLYNIYQFAASIRVGGDNNGPYVSNGRRAMILNLSEPKPLAYQSQVLMDFFDERLFGGTMSSGLRQITIEYIDGLTLSGSDDDKRQKRVEEALAILIASPEYTVQR